MFFSLTEVRVILGIQKKYGYMTCVPICRHLVKLIRCREVISTNLLNVIVPDIWKIESKHIQKKILREDGENIVTKRFLAELLGEIEEKASNINEAVAALKALIGDLEE